MTESHPSAPRYCFFAAFAIGVLGLGLGLWQGASGDRHPVASPRSSAGRPVAVPAAPSLSRETAIVCALNALAHRDDGAIELEHPAHEALFSPEGISFSPVRSRLDWNWSLTSIGSESVDLGIAASVKPVTRGLRSVAYPRSGFTEEYHARENCIEQRFVLHECPPIDGDDLIIRGSVSHPGTFEDFDHRWQWRDGETGAVVSLGDVWVFDAEGETIPATMQVTESSTEIVVDGPLLAAATYPVTVDPEIGTDDFVISSASIGGRWRGVSPRWPVACYNPTRHEFFVIWNGISSGMTFEIFGQRIDADTAERIGNQFQISDIGHPAFGDEIASIEIPDIVHNPVRNDYMMVWARQLPGPGQPEEIFAQRLTALGAKIGAPVQISASGTSNAVPRVAFNTHSDRYAVAWEEVSPELKVRAQFLDALGAKTGPTAFEVAPLHSASSGIDVAANPDNGEFLFAFGGVRELDRPAGFFTQRMDTNGALLAQPRRVHDSDVAATDFSRLMYLVRLVRGAPNQFGALWLQPVPGQPFTRGLSTKFASLGSHGGTNHPVLDLGDGARFVNLAATPDGTSYCASQWKARRSSTTHVAKMDTIDLASGQVTHSLDLGEEVADREDEGWTGIATGGGATLGLLLVRTQDAYGGELPEREIDTVFGALMPLPLDDSSAPDWKKIADDPVTVDPAVRATAPDVAYNATNDEYAVVWSAGEPAAGTAIQAQFVSANGGTTGVDTLISQQGTAAAPLYANDPAVAWNSRDNNYVVVWSGSASAASPTEYEIFGARFERDFVDVPRKLSTVGAPGQAQHDAREPEIAYNHDWNEFLVAWMGNPSATNWDVYGQLIDRFVVETRGGDFRITISAPDTIANRDAHDFDLVYAPAAEQYLCLYSARNPIVEAGENIIEERDGVWLQGVKRGGGQENFLLHLVPDASPQAQVAIARQTAPNEEFFVAWDGGFNAASQVITGRHLGGFIGGTMQFLGDAMQLSPDGELCARPSVVYSEWGQEFLVSWVCQTAPQNHQVFTRPVAQDGEAGEEALQVSQTETTATSPASLTSSVAVSAEGQYLSVWRATGDRAYLAEASTEIFGQRFRTDEHALRIVSMKKLGNLLRIDFTMTAGRQYVVQRSTDLQVWAAVSDVMTSADLGMNFWVTDDADHVRAFYRVVDVTGGE